MALEHLTLEELSDWHAKILLAVVRRYGVPAAMHLIGQSLQSLAAQAQLAESFKPVDILAMDPAGRWKHLLELTQGLMSHDPWRDLVKSSTELARRRTWQHEYSRWIAEPVLVRVERDAFARGTMRHVHRMKILQSAARGWSGVGCNFVAKVYMNDPASSTLLEADVILQQTAKWYAERFNEQGVPKPVDFLQCAMVDVPSRGVTYSVEAFLEGAFTKYSSNSGFVTDEVVRHTPHAFSHYTYELSQGEELVVDVQGVGDLLTDPQIHTRTGRRGSGDLGLRGMALFFASHQCNPICRQLRCKPFARPPAMPSSATLPAACLDESVGTTLHVPMGGSAPGALLTLQPPRQLLPPERMVPGTALGGAVLPPGSPKSSAVDEKHEPVESHAPIHFMLALLHARALRGGDETIGPGSHTSPALGLFHLTASAELRHLPAILALACLHQQIKPRKGVLSTLGEALQQPLGTDHDTSTHYTVLAAELGVASAMCAAAYACEHGIGTPPSASRAAQWYRRAIGARGQPDELCEEYEAEAERLPGGDASEEEVLSALARLYEAGGADLTPDTRLAQQFAYLARSSRRRSVEEEEEDLEEDELEGVQPAPTEESGALV